MLAKTDGDADLEVPARWPRRNSGSNRRQAPRAASGVRWRRFALLTVPAMVGAGLIVGLTGKGALAASFAVSGQTYKISADKLTADGVVLYGGVDTGLNGTKHPVGTAGFKKVTLYNLCLSTVVPSPAGDLTIRMTAGGGDTPVQATNMVADLDQLSGDADFTDVQIGVDASKQVKGPVSGPAGLGALQLDSATINAPKLRAWGAAAGTFKLTGLKIDVKFGKKECY